MKGLLLALFLSASTASAQTRERKIGDMRFIAGIFGVQSLLQVSAKVLDDLAVVSIYIISVQDETDYVTVYMERPEVKAWVDSVETLVASKPAVDKGETIDYSVPFTEHDGSSIDFHKRVGAKTQLFLYMYTPGHIRKVLQPADEKDIRKMIDLLRKASTALDDMTAKKPQYQ